MKCALGSPKIFDGIVPVTGGKIGIGDNCTEVTGLGGWTSSLKLTNCIVMPAPHTGDYYPGMPIVPALGCIVEVPKPILVPLA